MDTAAARKSAVTFAAAEVSFDLDEERHQMEDMSQPPTYHEDGNMFDPTGVGDELARRRRTMNFPETGFVPRESLDGIGGLFSMEGWLLKRGPRRGMDWRLRWCRLEGQSLSYYVTENPKTLRGRVILEPGCRIYACTDEAVSDDAKHCVERRPYAFEIFRGAKERNFLFDASTPEGLFLWLNSLNRALQIVERGGEGANFPLGAAGEAAGLQAAAPPPPGALRSGIPSGGAIKPKAYSSAGRGGVGFLNFLSTPHGAAPVPSGGYVGGARPQSGYGHVPATPGSGYGAAPGTGYVGAPPTSAGYPVAPGGRGAGFPQSMPSCRSPPPSSAYAVGACAPSSAYAAAGAPWQPPTFARKLPAKKEGMFSFLGK